MTTIRAAVIGTGPHPDESHESSGSSMGYHHADGYRAIDDCELVGCADLVPEHADAFVDHYGLSSSQAYEDYGEMLDALEPDIVSVCTPPSVHSPIVADCARHAAVRAIHCEKPIAPTFGESRQLVQTCADEDVQLTFNFQYRFRPGVRVAKELIDEGAIGSLGRVEVHRRDLMQTGVHNIDLANYFNDGADAEWVLGGIDYRDETVWYTDMYAEDQAIGLWAYDNGVHGFAFTGEESSDLVDGHVRVTGSEGAIKLRFWSETPIEVRRSGSAEWEQVDVDHEDDAQTLALSDTIAALRRGRQPLLEASNALRATEIVFGVWESARRRGRVELPLDIEDNPLEALIEDE